MNKKEIFEDKSQLTISYPKIDCSLFRYRPLNDYNYNSNKKNDDKLTRILDEIKTGNIYLSTISDLNDPFETQGLPDFKDNDMFNYHRLLQTLKKVKPGLYGVVCEKATKKIDFDTQKISFGDFVEISFKYFKETSSRSISKKAYKELLQKEYQKKYSSKISNALIACFSETEKSIPMWAYYANNFKGVCLEYDFTKILKKDIDKIVPYLFKVSYSSKMPSNKYNKIYSPNVKSIDWSHEREWRLVFLKDSKNIICENGKYYAYIPYLKGVIYGTNISLHQAQQIEKIIGEINKKRNKNKQIYIKMAEPLPNKYGIKITKELQFHYF